MDEEEFANLIGALRKSGLNDNQIMHVLIETYEQGKCDIADLELMVDWLGFHLTDEFYKAHGLDK